MGIEEHHQRAIDRLAQAYRDDPRFVALVIGGSVAKGFARRDSDVDFLIVATDEEFDRRMRERDLFINRTDLCDYEGGYVDGKVINLGFLESVAERGNEPSRAAFEGAFAAFSHVPGFDALLDRIPVYPEEGHAERIKAFYSMAFMGNWLMHEAERHGNRYAMLRAASQLVLYSGRLLLAHHRKLYPFHKWLLRTVEALPEKPADIMRVIDALVDEPSGAGASALLERVRGFRDWGVSDLDAYMWFMTEVEWSWMSGTTALEDV